MKAGDVKEKIQRRHLVSLSIILISIFAFYHALNAGLAIYVKSMADPVEVETQYPREAFEGSEVMDLLDRENISSLKDKDLPGSRWEKRSLVARAGFYDTAITGGYVLEAISTNNSRERPYTRGATSNMCLDQSRKPESCGEIPVFTMMVNGWIKLATASDRIGAIYHNETARESIGNYLERASYYDSFVGRPPADYIMAAQDSSGLYVIGADAASIRIGNITVHGEREGEWLYVNKTLETGSHKIQVEGEKMTLKIYRGTTDSAVVNGNLHIAEPQTETRFFNRVTVRGGSWKVSKQLKDNKTTVVELSDDRSKDVETVIFHRRNLSVRTSVNSKPDYNVTKHIFGLTDREHRTMKSIRELPLPGTGGKTLSR
ncbi:MAG: hypothetical protein ABEJ64_03055 [Candidatus Nanohaloarchaea archaeon]